MPMANFPRTRHGRGRPALPPAWLSAMPLQQWADIPGTANPGAGLAPDAYSDMTLRPSDSSLFIAAAGGHDNGNSNAVVRLALSADAPAWETLRASSWNGSEFNVTYYADGTPASRHTYHHTHYIASQDCVLLAGCRFGWGGGTPSDGSMALFDLATNQWRARNTWPDITPDALSTAGMGCGQDGAGNIWTQNGYKFTVSTTTWSKPGTGKLLRYPCAYDSARDRIFALQYNDGEGSQSQGLQAIDLNPDTGNSQNITFNSSAAVTQFIADNPAYAGMAFCPLDGKFYFMHMGRQGVFYVVTPNGTTVWDMAMWTPGGALPSTTETICKRVLYVPALNGFVFQYKVTQPLKFLRMV